MNLSLHLPSESTVTSPETVTVSSPVPMTGTIPFAVDMDGSSTTFLTLTLQNPGSPLSNPSALSAGGSVSGDVTGGRVLTVGWMFTDWDAGSPPSDQFDVTVTDASGKVTGHLAQTAQYSWIAPSTCQTYGHWNGPTLSDQDGGVDHLIAF